MANQSTVPIDFYEYDPSIGLPVRLIFGKTVPWPSDSRVLAHEPIVFTRLIRGAIYDCEFYYAGVLACPPYSLAYIEDMTKRRFIDILY